MKKCCDNLGELRAVLFVPNYSHIMSEKIRAHLIKRFWEKNNVFYENLMVLNK